MANLDGGSSQPHVVVAAAVINPPVAPVSNTALANRKQIFDGAGALSALFGHSTKSTDQWVLLIDSSASPADGAVPKHRFRAFANDNFSETLAVEAQYFTNGCWACNSSSADVLTAGAADCWFTGFKKTSVLT